MKMSTTQICTRQVKFNFYVPVADLTEFNTPEISVDEIPWTIRVRKIAVNARKSRSKKQDVEGGINLFLMCNYKAQSEDIKWCIVAGAALKLISHKKSSEPVEKIFPMMKFTNAQLMASLENFISWNELVDEKNHYLKDDKITFEATITSGPLCQSGVARLCEISSTTFGMVLKDVKNLKTTYSSKVNVRGIEWTVLFRKHDNNCLGVYLNMNTKIEHFAWSLLVDFKVKLLSHSNDIKFFERKFQHRFHSDSIGWGWPKFITWNGLLNKSARHVESKHAYFDISIDVGPHEPFWKIEETNHLINNDSTSTMKCPVCLDSFKDNDKEVVATGCGHLFCVDCIRSSIQLNNKCPLCNVPAAAIDLRPIYC